jgi:hypothetical protein
MSHYRICYACGKYVFERHTCNASEYTKRHATDRTSFPIPDRQNENDRLKLGFAMMRDDYED